MTRYDFLKSTALAGLGTCLNPGLLRAAAPSMGIAGLVDRMGLQLFSVPALLGKDTVETLELIAGMGYSEIELFGPFPFSAESNKDSWAKISTSLGISGSGFFGLTREEFAKQ